MYYQVKEVANMTGLTVRTLHHYDAIGLLRPEKVSEGGYRQYSQDDLMVLQQILFLKELDFSLATIGKMLADPAHNHSELLVNQKMLLQKKVERLQRIIANIERTQKMYERGETMSTEETFDGFDMKEIEAHKKKYAEEVKERWGGTDAYRQSAKRTADYGPEDYKRIMEATNATYDEIVSLMDRDVSDEWVQKLVHSLREGITENFYDCTLEIFAGLGEMYTADSRFTKNLDKHGEGFAAYLSKAIAYYCSQQN